MGTISAKIVLSLRFSADLEITVQMLVQIDKLVQLIESPVFTCTLPYSLAVSRLILRC